MRSLNLTRIPLFILTFLLVGIAAVSVSAGERTLVPTPPQGGPGVSTFAPDAAIPYTRSADPPELTEHMQRRLAERTAAEGLPAKFRSPGDIGGDDVEVDSYSYLSVGDVAIASNGDIYVAVSHNYWLDNPEEVYFYRSQDGGDTWSPWGELRDPTGLVSYFWPYLHIAEGIVDKCFVAYMRIDSGATRSVWVASSDLSLATGDFSSEIMVMGPPDGEFGGPDITSDAISWDDYYIYVVAVELDSNGWDIWFARSTDQGANFEPAYEIGTISLDDRDYAGVDVAYGFGGYVHVAWHLESRTDAFDSAIRYRRAPSYANGGLAGWDPIIGPTGTANGIWEEEAQIAASATGNQVVIAHKRFEELKDKTLAYADPGVLGSSDQGSSFPVAAVLTDGAWGLNDLEYQPGGDWIIGGERYDNMCIQRSNGMDITTWSAIEAFNDGVSGLSGRYPFIALDPSRGNQIAMVWSEIESGAADDDYMFDAEWRAGPGYPNLEDGFPLDLTATPESPPAVVDLDGDDDLEIVFSDDAGYIQAFHHDGTQVAGWPVDVGVALSDGPVAIGDMQNNGTLMLLVGTNSGLVHAYYVDGSPVPGWPFNTGMSAPAYVSIGALGGPYPRMAAVCAGDHLYFLNNHGIIYHGFSWFWPNKTFSAPVAIGDVDGDGVAEAVGGVSDWVFAVHATEASGVFGRAVPSNVSDAVTLGDFDGDGDVETVVPTTDGSLYLLDDDGSDFPGTWPFISSTASALTSGAISDCLGTSEPEIAVGARNWHVHLVYYHGGQHPNYPKQTDGWLIYGAPITTYLPDIYSADVVIGARGNRGWAWSNLGQLIPGWPKWFDDNVYVSPAAGDLDLDGSTEIVFLTQGQMVVVDVNQAPSYIDGIWPMYAYDPQRTGCWLCPEDLATAVGPGEVAEADGVTRVLFSPPTPNPIAGAATFSYAVPGRAQVRLEIFDVRGRRVATVMREEASPGEHAVAWDGRDDRGRDLASGRYLARLQVQGPDLNEIRVQKITLLR